jgi:hypothetical protein
MELFKKTLLVAVLGLLVADVSAMKRTREQADAQEYIVELVRPGIYKLGLLDSEGVCQWSDSEYTQQNGVWVYTNSRIFNDGQPVFNDQKLHALNMYKPSINRRFVVAARNKTTQAINAVVARPNLSVAVLAGFARLYLAGFNPANSVDAVGLVLESGFLAGFVWFVASRANDIFNWTAQQIQQVLFQEVFAQAAQEAFIQ